MIRMDKMCKFMYHYIFNTLLRRSNEPCIQGDPCLYGLARTPAGCHAANGDLRIWHSVFFKLRIDAFYDLRKHLHPCSGAMELVDEHGKLC